MSTDQQALWGRDWLRAGMLWLCGWAVMWLAGAMWAPAARAEERLNVLFLLTDDQRPDAVGAFGHQDVKTPHLDELVQRGFTFENTYCMGSTMPAVCNPSRHMIQSGMSLYRYEPQPGEQTPSLARSFRQAGYETYHHSKKGNSARAYHAHYEHSQYLDDEQARTSGHHGRDEAEAAIAFLKRRDNSRPFFMYIGFAGPHDPRVAAEEWLKQYQREQLTLPKNLQPFHPFDNGELLIRDEGLAEWPRTEEIVRRHLHDYYGCITSIDHHIGRILATLKAAGELERTLILVISDHGLALGSHGLFGKQNLYEHSMRSPLVVAGPGIRQGSTPALMYLFDIYPTLCDLAEVPLPSGIEGRSQKPVIAGEVDAVRKTVYLAYRQQQRAVRHGDWKLLRYPAINRNQLFNVKHDPDELQDLAADPAHQSELTDLLGLLALQHAEWNDPYPLTVKQAVAGEIPDAEFLQQQWKSRQK